MRRKLLSYIIILAVVVAAVIVHRAITSFDGGGAAQASLSTLGAPTGESRSYSRKNLAKDISFNPDRLLNIRGQDVKTVLREPELIREESPTTIWQYRTDACVLDVYFAGDKDPLMANVVHYEIRARAKDVKDADIQTDCIRELARKSGRPRMIDVSALYKGYSQ